MKNTAQHQTKTTCCFNKEQPTYPFLGERQKQTTLKSLTLSLVEVVRVGRGCGRGRRCWRPKGRIPSEGSIFDGRSLRWLSRMIGVSVVYIPIERGNELNSPPTPVWHSAAWPRTPRTPFQGRITPPARSSHAQRCIQTWEITVDGTRTGVWRMSKREKVAGRAFRPFEIRQNGFSSFEIVKEFVIDWMLPAWPYNF